jgi:hypothetical protein
MIAAGLGEIAPGRNAQLTAEVLKQDRHQIGNQDDGQQRITELRSARQICRPIAGVHVTDRDEKAWPGEGEHLSPIGSLPGNDNAAVNFGKAHLSRLSLPCCQVGIGCIRLQNSFVHFLVRLGVKL